MNKKWLKWVAGLTLAATLAVPQLASADTGHVTVKVRLFGPNGLVQEKYIQVGAESFTNTNGDTITLNKPTALGALVELLNEEHITFEAKTVSFGTYVSKIGDVAEKTINSNTGWGDWVDGQTPSVGADQTEIKNGDEIDWAFYDYTQTLYPQVQVSANRVKTGSDITVKVTAQKTTYDANYNATTTTVPVVGANVTVAGDTSSTGAIVTDANGQATIPATHDGLISFYVDKVDSTGLPLVIRSGTINVLAANPTLSFSDLNHYGWAASAVQTLADRGVVVGDGQSHFQPDRAVTRGELAKMIALNGDLNLGGTATFADLNASNTYSYSNYVQTVVREGFMSGDNDGTFRPSAPITREELATVLVRLAGLQPATDTSGLTFGDRASIHGFALPYVKTAVTNGLLVGDDHGNFDPQATASRAEVAKALVNVLNQQSTK